MRKLIFATLMTLGVGLAGASTSVAAPVTGAAILDAANTVSATEVVHCRRYWHSHWRHRWRTTRMIRWWHRC
jgi:hypothetical protein